MAESPDCEDSEDIVKGVLSTDVQNGNVNWSIFAGKESSYSRLKIYSVSRILRIFRRQLPEPPKNLLAGYLILNVGKIKEVGRNHKTKENKQGHSLTVVPNPDKGYWGNKSHAITQPKITDGLAKKMKEAAIGSQVDFKAHQREGLVDRLIWLVKGC